MLCISYYHVILSHKQYSLNDYNNWIISCCNQVSKYSTCKTLNNYVYCETKSRCFEIEQQCTLQYVMLETKAVTLISNLKSTIRQNKTVTTMKKTKHLLHIVNCGIQFTLQSYTPWIVFFLYDYYTSVKLWLLRNMI